MIRTEIRWVLLPFEMFLEFVLVGIAAVLAAGQLYTLVRTGCFDCMSYLNEPGSKVSAVRERSGAPVLALSYYQYHGLPPNTSLEADE